MSIETFPQSDDKGEFVEENKEEVYFREAKEKMKEGDILVNSCLIDEVEEFVALKNISYEKILNVEVTENYPGEYIIRINDKLVAEEVFKMLRQSGLNVEIVSKIVNLDKE